MLGKRPAVHQQNGEAVEALRAKLGKAGSGLGFVERNEHFAARANALVHFGDRGMEHLRQHDVAGKNFGSGLRADPQRVGEAARGDQRGALALALEQGIGRDGGAHADRAQRPALIAQKLADALEGGVGIVARVLRQQLEHSQRAVRAARDDVGESATPIDGEGPDASHRRLEAGTPPSLNRRGRPRSCFCRPERTLAHDHLSFGTSQLAGAEAQNKPGRHDEISDERA